PSDHGHKCLQTTTSGNTFPGLLWVVFFAIHEKRHHSDEYCSHSVFCNSSCDYEDRTKSSLARICEWESREGRGYFREKSRGSVVLGEAVCPCHRDHY